MTDKNFYTVKDIMKMLGISRGTAYKLLKMNKFHSVLIGNRYFVPKTGFDRWFNGEDKSSS